MFSRSVAQPGSASALGAEGREFESRRSDHFSPRHTSVDTKKTTKAHLRAFCVLAARSSVG